MIEVAWTHRAQEHLREIYQHIVQDRQSRPSTYSFWSRMVPEYQNPTIRESLRVTIEQSIRGGFSALWLRQNRP